MKTKTTNRTNTKSKAQPATPSNAARNARRKERALFQKRSIAAKKAWRTRRQNEVDSAGF